MASHGQQLITRRQALEFIGLGASALIAAPLFSGCAVDPVTGRSQLMMVSEEEEIALDRKQSPYQFSSDYGVVQDQALNAYITSVGTLLSSRSHRPQMPYSFRGVNAAYINAYAFPGGSVAVTRGILVELKNEAELAALLGHEIGHINARHASEQMSSSTLTQALLATASIVTSAAGYGGGADLIQQLGGLGAGALLAHYSRDNEREADELGMEYMARAGYTPQGMVGLMEVLLQNGKHKPSAIELMFSTHPMSEERYQTALQMSQDYYRAALAYPDNRERYMDSTADLRRIKKAITAIQEAEEDMRKEKLSEAESQLNMALQVAPEDYAALLMMSKCKFAQEQSAEAKRYALMATEVYPQEAQAHGLSGLLYIMEDDYSRAYTHLNDYNRLLPGNPQVIFYKGLSLEGMGRRREAAKDYKTFLSEVRNGKAAQYAYQRLREWGYIRN